MQQQSKMVSLYPRRHAVLVFAAQFQLFHLCACSFVYTLSYAVAWLIYICFPIVYARHPFIYCSMANLHLLPDRLCQVLKLISP